MYSIVSKQATPQCTISYDKRQAGHYGTDIIKVLQTNKNYMSIVDFLNYLYVNNDALVHSQILRIDAGLLCVIKLL